MKHLFVLITLLVSCKAYSQTTEQVLDESIQEMSEGMTPEMKKLFEEKMEHAKSKMKEFDSLPKEEQQKIIDQPVKPMTESEISEMKKSFDQMSEEDKKMMDVLRKNLGNKIDEVNKMSQEAKEKQKRP